MTVIVTGATSFIGRAVVKALLEEGCRVVAVSRPASAGAGKLQELFEDLKKQAGAGKEHWLCPAGSSHSSGSWMQTLFVFRFPGRIRDL